MQLNRAKIPRLAFGSLGMTTSFVVIMLHVLINADNHNDNLAPQDRNRAGMGSNDGIRTKHALAVGLARKKTINISSSKKLRGNSARSF